MWAPPGQGCLFFPCDPISTKLFVIHLITNICVTADVGSGEDTVSRKPAIRLENSQMTYSLSIDSEWLALPTAVPELPVREMVVI